MPQPKITVVIADDTLIAREGLKRIIETTTDIEVVGEAMTAYEIQRKAIELKPQVVLMDLKWFGDDAVVWITIREIKHLIPKVKIIIVTANQNLTASALLAGADLVLLKTFTREELLDGIRELIFPASNTSTSIAPKHKYN